jgi:hypothetical protein
MDGFFRILKKAVSELICTRLYKVTCAQACIFCFVQTNRGNGSLNHRLSKDISKINKVGSLVEMLNIFYLSMKTLPMLKMNTDLSIIEVK